MRGFSSDSQLEEEFQQNRMNDADVTIQSPPPFDAACLHLDSNGNTGKSMDQPQHDVLNSHNFSLLPTDPSIAMNQGGCDAMYISNIST